MHVCVITKQIHDFCGAKTLPALRIDQRAGGCCTCNEKQTINRKYFCPYFVNISSRFAYNCICSVNHLIELVSFESTSRYRGIVKISSQV